MLNSNINLNPNLFNTPSSVPTRDGFGKGIVEAGKIDDRVMVLTADLAESTRAEWFQKEFPKRFIEIGVSEQNMIAVASGLANYGKIPFVTSYAAFNPGRNWEVIRTTVALTKLPVIVCGMHAGVSVGPDGATHQMLEDIALMRALPHMTVISPCDAEEARKATTAAAQLGAPVYMRFGREKTPVMTTTETPFSIGKVERFWGNEAPDILICATGLLVYQALIAAKELSQMNIAVLNVHTIKPLDEETILAHARSARAVVSVEEHQVAGGLGGALAELFARTMPKTMRFVGVQNQFGQSGIPNELLTHYKLDASGIIEAITSL